MDAIVSLLDAEHDAAVRALWDELRRTFGVGRVVALVPFPHMTYHGADVYDTARLEPLLDRIAHGTRPFVIQTAGLGIFSGPRPVLYLSVVRSPQLSAFHAALCQEVNATATGLARYYQPDDQWMPHITVAQWDISKENLPGIIGALTERAFAWEIVVDHLALVCQEGEGYAVRQRFPFTGVQ